MNNSYPFPERSNLPNEDCFYVPPDLHNFEQVSKVYQRKISQESINIKLQYFLVENELLSSFQYVNPVEQNLSTSSVKFATIIREASNLFEQISRIIYSKLFINVDKINIYNYLSLDKFLNLNDLQFTCPTLRNMANNNTNLLKPFNKILTWDKMSKTERDNIPTWWIAFNKLKHSPNNLTEFSTMENAIQSLLAAYIMINKYLGPGVISGDLFKPEHSGNKIIHGQIRVEQSRLFIYKEGSLGFEF